MKVYVVYGFWEYENGAVILEVFDDIDKAREYVNNFDYSFKVSKYHSEFDFLDIEVRVIK